MLPATVRWVAERWCRQFCVTIKFRGTDDYAKLDPIKSWLAESGADFLLRRLTSNKKRIHELNPSNSDAFNRLGMWFLQLEGEIFAHLIRRIDKRKRSGGLQ